MKPLKLSLLLLSSTALVAAPALKEPAKAKQIAKKMIDRNDGKTSYSKVQLLSCRFKQSGGKRKCASTPRKKVFESVSKDVGRGGKDSTGLSVIITPPAEKGVSFLQKDYDRSGKDSDQWIFLPALKKLKRIVSESSNKPKTGTFFGSELAYEDMEKIHLSDYDYSYLGEETVDGRAVYVLESFPTKRRARKSSYSRQKIWVDKKTYMPVKSQSYDRRGKLAKTFFMKKLRKVNGVWVAQMQIVVNHKNKRMSMMKNDKQAINLRVPGGLLTPRAAKDASYRDGQMGSIRSKAK